MFGIDPGLGVESMFIENGKVVASKWKASGRQVDAGKVNGITKFSPRDALLPLLRDCPTPDATRLMGRGTYLSTLMVNSNSGFVWLL